MQRRKDNKGRVLKDGEVYRKSDGLYMYRWTAKTENATPSMMQLWRGCAKGREDPARFGRWPPHPGVQLDPERPV